MSNQKSQSSLLNRNMPKSEEAKTFQSMLQEVEKETINSSLATQFPDWDITPPATLVKRRSTKLL